MNVDDMDRLELKDGENDGLMYVWRFVEGQKVQCGVAGTLECGGCAGGGPAWQTLVVWTLAA